MKLQNTPEMPRPASASWQGPPKEDSQEWRTTNGHQAEATDRAAERVDDTQSRPLTARRRIEVRGLCKRFDLPSGSVAAVDGVSLDVREGEFVSLIGPSGCGKSTILNMIAGLLPRSAGDIEIDEEAVGHEWTSPKLGYIFQRDTCYPWRTLAQNIGLGLHLAKLPRHEVDARVSDAIAQAGLHGFEDAFPSMLSGGMRQRVSLMRTLIMRPQILLMDEPFGALDTHTKLEMHKLLLQLWESQRQTVVFVTHDLAEALTLSDRIVLLSARPGRIKEIFDIPFARPRDPVELPETAQYRDKFSEIWHSLGEEFKKGKA
jgi:NitT/TauT family transport system ATP-binding protein